MTEPIVLVHKNTRSNNAGMRDIPNRQSFIFDDRGMLIIHAAMFVGILGYDILNISRMGGYYFYFLTDWNWVLNVTYFGIAFVKSLYIYRNQSHSLHQVSVVMFSVILPISILVTVIFWALLANAAVFNNHNDYNRGTSVTSHVVNLGFPLIELFITTVDPPWIYGLYSCAVLLFYAITIIIVHFVSSMDWPYSFLDTLNGGQSGMRWGPMLGFVAGMFVLLYILFAATVGMIKLRNYFARKRLIKLRKDIQTEQGLKDVTTDQAGNLESQPLDRQTTATPLRQSE